MMEQIQVPVSPGELLDKITILEIKSERMSDAAKLANVRLELSILNATWSASVSPDTTIERIHDNLKHINEALWEIEDDIRDKERAGEFDKGFIALARAVAHAPGLRVYRCRWGKRRPRLVRTLVVVNPDEVIEAFLPGRVIRPYPIIH